MATFNKEDLIKWNDLSTSLQDIIMRKITWDMLHPDLQAWLLDKEKRIIELERWRKTKVDPMLDDHENRIDNCESEISRIWSKLSSVESDIDGLEQDISNVANNAAGGGELFDIGIQHYIEKDGMYRFYSGIKGAVTASGWAEITISIRFDFHFIKNGQYLITPIGPIAQDLSKPVDNYSINLSPVEGQFNCVGYIHPNNPNLNPLGLTSPIVNHYIMTMWRYIGPDGGNSLAFTNDSGRIYLHNYDPLNKRYPQDFKMTDLDDGTVEISEALLAPFFTII